MPSAINKAMMSLRRIGLFSSRAAAEDVARSVASTDLGSFVDTSDVDDAAETFAERDLSFNEFGEDSDATTDVEPFVLVTSPQETREDAADHKQPAATRMEESGEVTTKHAKPDAKDPPSANGTLSEVTHTEKTAPAETLKVTVTPRYDVIGVDSGMMTTHVCATVKARSIMDDRSFDRASVDVIVALDVSESMAGSKLGRCKRSLELILRELRPNDRFGMITFNEDARIVVPFGHLSPETKRGALGRIRNIRAGGHTNLAGALEMASREMIATTSPNEVRSIFLLTDGQANCGTWDRHDIVNLSK